MWERRETWRLAPCGGWLSGLRLPTQLDQSHFYRTRVGCGLEGVWYDESKLRQFNPGGGDRSPVSKCLHKISFGCKHAWKRSEQADPSRHHQDRLCGGARRQLRSRGQEVGCASRGRGVKAATWGVLCLPHSTRPHAPPTTDGAQK